MEGDVIKLRVGTDADDASIPAWSFSTSIAIADQDRAVSADNEAVARSSLGSCNLSVVGLTFTGIPSVRSKSSREKQDDENYQDDADETDTAIAVAVERGPPKRPLKPPSRKIMSMMTRIVPSVMGPISL